MKAVSDFERKDFSGIMNGIRDVGAALQELPDIIEQCINNSTDDIKRIEDWALMFKNPQAMS